jgi:hypothetical protein
MNILKSMLGIDLKQSQADTTADEGDPDPSNPWLFTDPDARAEFQRGGRLQELRRDIIYEVMRAQDWTAEELEYKRAIRDLLRRGAVADKGSYWYMSPFPTVYRALRAGEISIGGEVYRFQEGDDIVFQCRMTRDSDPSLRGPCLVARLQDTDRAMLCGEMGSAMKGMD